MSKSAVSIRPTATTSVESIYHLTDSSSASVLTLRSQTSETISPVCTYSGEGSAVKNSESLSWEIFLDDKNIEFDKSLMSCLN